MSAWAGPMLYVRSRGLPGVVGVLAATAAFVAWWGSGGPEPVLPLVALAPLVAAAAIGTSFHTPGGELDRTAVAPWWPRRLSHLVALTALASLALALVAPETIRPGPDPGTPVVLGAEAMARNTVGAAGLAALGVRVVGARLSWVVPLGYLGVVFLGVGDVGAVWGWAARAEGDLTAALTAAALFTTGASLSTLHPRPSGG
ncbi:hypothetical protein [Streptomyces sp. NPDC001985]|uniref:hypothetical protein n=1 Tax=Streptomyces sp. NPDC001985 TaxID=3154406 RepID=UPI00332F4BA8